MECVNAKHATMNGEERIEGNMTCPRCIKGCLAYEQVEWRGRYQARCIQCGWAYNPPLVEDARKGTAYLPVVVDMGRKP